MLYLNSISSSEVFEAVCLISNCHYVFLYLLLHKPEECKFTISMSVSYRVKIVSSDTIVQPVSTIPNLNVGVHIASLPKPGHSSASRFVFCARCYPPSY